jgi:hypothetical protein
MSNSVLDTMTLCNSAESLNKTFKDIIEPKCMDYELWKIGVYFTEIENLTSGEQGEVIEKLFSEIIDAKRVNHKVVNGFRKKGVVIKHDLTFSNLVTTQFKTSLREKGVYDYKDEMSYSHNSIKIFDTSRNKFNTDQLSTLHRLLDEIGWDLNILLYVYEKETKQGCLCFTSLSEMTISLFGNNDPDNMIKLFKYDIGGSHYFIDRGDVYHTSRDSNRCIEFKVPSHNDMVDYINSKSTLSTLIDKVF